MVRTFSIQTDIFTYMTEDVMATVELFRELIVGIVEILEAILP